MRFIIEIDGPVFDIVPVYHAAHCAVADELGWSHLDLDRFQRALRNDGANANVLPAAKPAKLAAYAARFPELLETDVSVASHQAQAGIENDLQRLVDYGSCIGLTLGFNLEARLRLLSRSGLTPRFSEVHKLNLDPRRRGGELKLLANGDQRTVVVAASDDLVRAAGGADQFVVGVVQGACSKSRLFQAGAAVVYRNFQDFADSATSGAADMIEVGLLPPSLG